MARKAVMFKYLIICACVLSLDIDVAIAHSHLTETRYCGEVVRNADGSIKRSSTVRKAFEKLHPLPSTYNRADWQIDHVIPLSVGGCDSVSNMQWLPKMIKTCAADYCKDRWERSGVY